MNRDINSRFALTPSSIEMKRSIFQRNSDLKTTFNSASIVPIYVDEILPGDSIDMKTASVVRMTTSIHPTMDSAFIDTYFFFVPIRQVWDNWEEFCGANPNPWITSMPVHSIPQLSLSSADTVVGSIYDYLGIPVGYAGTINSLPLRCYNKIYNEWFRDTNLMSEVAVPTGDTGDSTLYYTLKKACKLHDYFTSALPGPQRHADVTLPLGTQAPVFGIQNKPLKLYENGTGVGPIYVDSLSGKTGASGYWNLQAYNTSSTATTQKELYLGNKTQLGNDSPLYADLTQATASTVNQLRLAFQTQKFYERMGIATGGRYVSVLKAMFGVNNGDLRLQRPEYLGGNRATVSMAQVTQNSQTATTPLGTVAGQSVTRGSNGSFNKSFTEHGYLIGVAVVRPQHTYQYGIDKLWSRRDLLDFYWPSFAFIGEQPILNKEIYANGTASDDAVFGYQEAWAEYRYKPSRVSGYMRSGVTGTLDSYHYADKYTALPTLGSTWIEETPNNIDRTLAVQSAAAHQFIGNFYFSCKHTRVMPVYSVPGLIDHF